ncbi:hypothetical protein GDO78_009173 [Eleutherodactylus coqui]|uniref:Uncharacterized protein n=1 Tax=Eleutherodactylus coqui TaxID=57060 RepID=A0A8J6F9E5_ELECQ|nr:hypothetical protein GDO78_009173 [Eleutherodactylus coqui]
MLHRFSIRPQGTRMIRFHEFHWQPQKTSCRRIYTVFMIIAFLWSAHFQMSRDSLCQETGCKRVHYIQLKTYVLYLQTGG